MAQPANMARSNQAKTHQAMAFMQLFLFGEESFRELPGIERLQIVGLLP